MIHPVFGPLEREGADYPWWNGRARIPALAGCRARWVMGLGTEPYERPRVDEPAPVGDEFAVRVHDPDARGPTAQQERALTYLQENGREVLRAALAEVGKLVREVYFPQELGNYRGPDPDGFLGRLEELARPERIPELVTLSGVDFCQEAEGGIALVALNFGCSFDEEHGLAVLLHKDQVREVAGSDEFAEA